MESSNNKKGFSLVEMLVALFISSLIMLAVVASFAGVVRARKNIVDTQKKMEDARAAMELITKMMRMSSNVTPNSDGSKVYMFNFSVQKCVSFQVSSVGQILEATCDPWPQAKADSRCKTVVNRVLKPCRGAADTDPAIPFPAATAITDRIIDDGRFSVDVTDPEIAMGKATLEMAINGRTLQSTVSFRDYDRN